MNTILNIVLFPIFLVYISIICIRNYLYDINILKSTRLSCKIISVGNITVGGTGKTPTTIAIVKYLQKKNKTVAILSRGYGRKSTGTQLVTNGKDIPANWNNIGDEPALMAKQLSNIPIVVDENRVRGGQYIIDKFHSEIIVLDDGFQHRKIYRDIDIVLINYNISKISKRIFGFLNFREPWKSLKRANLIILTKSNFVAPSNKLLKKLKTFALPMFKANISPSPYLLDNNNNKITLDYFSGKTALLFSGIGDPESFKKTVQSLNIIILNSIHFRDHKNYSSSDIQKILNKFKNSNADIIITTEKDFLKIDDTTLPIYILPIKMKINESCYNQILNLVN